jgi:glyoxylase-like metal-dependent hydrolase (beta-lactamase superfamily II)
MVEEVVSNLYRIEVPLPGSPLKSVNSYVFKSHERNLVVDTGLNREECREAMEAGLQELGVDLAKTDFFITHLHADHFGLVSRLVKDSSKIYFNRPDKEIIEAWGGWEPMIQYGRRIGFPEDLLRAALNAHPGFKYGSQWVPELSVLHDGETIRAGDYTLRCVATPGHTRGHMCLYEPTKKFLLAGDHMLRDITPNIQCWSDQDDPLKDYLASLDKVDALEVDLVLPGHRILFTDFHVRIHELKSHHRRRADEVLQILEDGAKDAFQVASRMTWDIDCDSWDHFPVAQKWFATGEAVSHLRYLEEQGHVGRTNRGEGVAFRLV